MSEETLGYRVAQLEMMAGKLFRDMNDALIDMEDNEVNRYEVSLLESILTETKMHVDGLVRMTHNRFNEDKIDWRTQQ